MINIREPESMYKRFNICQILLAYRDNTKWKTFKQKLVVIVMERVTEKYIYVLIHMYKLIFIFAAVIYFCCWQWVL